MEADNACHFTLRQLHVLFLARGHARLGLLLCLSRLCNQSHGRFSEVSTLVHFLRKTTIETTFENVLICHVHKLVPHRKLKSCSSWSATDRYFPSSCVERVISQVLPSPVNPLEKWQIVSEFPYLEEINSEYSGISWRRVCVAWSSSSLVMELL